MKIENSTLSLLKKWLEWKKEPHNVMPAKPKIFLLKKYQHDIAIASTFQNHRLENKLPRN